VYVYIYIYIYVFMLICVYTYIFTYLYQYIHYLYIAISEKVVLTSEDFIRLAKEFVAYPSEDKLAEDFVYRGPLIGPIGNQSCMKIYIYIYM
jgi:hypothetical protein